MKRRTILLIASLVMAYLLFPFKRKQLYNYLIYVPDLYKGSNQSYPLMIFLHGADERGDDLEKVKLHGPPKLVAEGRQFDFIIVSPQCPKGESWDREKLRNLILNIKNEYRIDSNRIYATGISMGGGGTWDLAINCPEMFAAIVPICGALEDGMQKKVCSIKDIPTKVFHGEDDEEVPVDDSIKMVSSLKKCGGNVQLTIYPDTGHDSWTKTYNDYRLYDWLLKQKRTI